jgi:hypothetical protein
MNSENFIEIRDEEETIETTVKQEIQEMKAEKIETMELVEEEKKVQLPPKQLLKNQIFFYFSDANFPFDKFLRGQAEKDKDGCKFCVKKTKTFRR